MQKVTFSVFKPMYRAHMHTIFLITIPNIFPLGKNLICKRFGRCIVYFTAAVM